MGSGIVFWIVCGCLIFSLCESLWRSFRAIINSETKQDVSDRWCGLIDNVFVYFTIEDWKEKHQAELSGTTEEENNKDNTDTEPKDE